MFNTNKKHLLKTHQPLIDYTIDINSQTKKSGLKVKQSANNILYSFKDDRYPSSPASCSNISYAVGTQGDTPPNPSGPTLVDLSMSISHVTDFDNDRNSYNIRGKLYTVWCDPRKTFDPLLGKYLLTNDPAADQVILQAQMWFPEITFFNQTTARTSSNILIYNFNDGTIFMSERFVVNVFEPLDKAIRKIPFDVENIVMDIGSMTQDTTQLKFVKKKLLKKNLPITNNDTDSSDSTQSNDFDTDENFHMPEFEKSTIHYSRQKKNDISTGRTHSQMHVELEINRKWGVQILIIFLPIFILILITSIPFSQSNQELPSRLAINLSCLLASIVLQALIQDRVPKKQFVNFLNCMLFSGIVIIFQAILIQTFLYKLHCAGYEKGAKKISFYMIFHYNLLQLIILIDLQFTLVEEIPTQGVLTSIWLLGGFTVIGYEVYDDFKCKDKDNELDNRTQKMFSNEEIGISHSYTKFSNKNSQELIK